MPTETNAFRPSHPVRSRTERFSRFEATSIELGSPHVEATVFTPDDPRERVHSATNLHAVESVQCDQVYRDENGAACTTILVRDERGVDHSITIWTSPESIIAAITDAIREEGQR